MGGTQDMIAVAKYHGTMRVRWFYPMGTVDDLFLRNSTQLSEE